MRAISIPLGLVLFVHSFVSNAAAGAGSSSACEKPTVVQQVVYCKKLELKASDQHVLQHVDKALQDYKANDKNMLATNRLPLAAPLFEKAQSSWAAFKEASCKAEYNYTGNGSLREIAYLDCLLAFNKKRVEQLSD